MSFLHRRDRAHTDGKALLIFPIFLAGSLSALAQTAQPLKTVVPVHIDVTTGNITVGHKQYKGVNPGMHLLALKRLPGASLDTPDLIDDGTFTDAASANQFLQTLSSPANDAILLANAAGNYGFPLNAVAANLENFGAPASIEPYNYPFPYVLIGNTGRKSGQGSEAGASAQNIDGYLAQDTNGKYIFIQTDYVRYGIGLDGTIKIGAATYDVASSYKYQPLCSGSAPNSFHLVIVDRYSLQLNTPVNNTYCTAAADYEIVRLIGDLAAWGNSEGRLVFLASNGHPIPANVNFGTDGDTRIAPLAKLVAQLGGYWETMVYLTPSDTYSLVGSFPPPAGTPEARKRARESSSVYPDSPTGELHGVLARGHRGMWYYPLNSDPTGLANLDFYNILAQTPVPFPHPNTIEELSAYLYISSKLCGSATCNVRNQYGDTSIDIGAYLTILEGLSDPNGNPCIKSNANSPFCIVRQQLLTEMTYVPQIRGLYGNLQTLWLGSGTAGLLSLLSAIADVEANLPKPPAPSAPAPSLSDSIAALFLSIFSYVPDFGAIAGIGEAAMNFGNSLTTDSGGNQTSSISIPVSQLEQDASFHFTNQAGAIGTQFDLIYQDWGKIQSLGSALTGAQPGSPWYWDSSTTAEILTAMRPVVSTAAYRSVMSTVYEIGSYDPDCASYSNCTPVYNQPYDYLIAAVFSLFSQPFLPSPDIYIPFTYPSDTTNPYQAPGNASFSQATSTLLGDGGWLGISLQTTPFYGVRNKDNYYTYQPPDTPVTAKLFTPLSQGGLGVYRPAFFENWPFPRLLCQPSSRGGTGCHWSTGAPPAETSPDPVSRIAIRMGTITRSGTVIKAPLLIVNNGTVAANPQIRTVSVRALGGSGQAVLVAPGLPLNIGALAPTAYAWVTLQIDVPPGLTKLIVTEEGTVDSGRKDPVRFSEGQVIYPKTVK